MKKEKIKFENNMLTFDPNSFTEEESNAIYNFMKTIRKSNNYMKWLPIDKDNLPKGEVLAANFTPSKYGYEYKIIGYLRINNDDGSIECADDEGYLENCTHYIDLSKFDL